MKTLRLILTTLVAVATLGFASCSKDASNSNPEIGTKAEISISLKSGGETRAAGDSKTKEIVNNYAAFAFKSDGALDGHVFVTGTGESTFEVTTGTKSVYVVANVPQVNFETASKLNITTLASLQAHLEKLTTDNALSLVTKANVWASGANTTAPTFAQNPTTKKWEAKISVPIKFAVSKVNLTVTNNMINLDASVAAIYKVTDIVVLSAVSESKLFPPTATPPTTSLMPTTPAYLAGMDVTSLGNVPTSTTATFLKDASTALSTFGSTEKFHYYLLENDAIAYATIISVVLEKTVLGVTTNRYFPVHFTEITAAPGNVYAGYNLVRNNQYQVNLKLTGDAAGEPGITDPTDTVADIEVTVTLENWNIIADINKEL